MSIGVKAVSDDAISSLNKTLEKIGSILEHRFGSPPEPVDLNCADAFVWHAESGALQPVKKVNRVEMQLLKGVDRVRDILLENTERFSRGFAANNALLWGARGMGKSSLVKAIHADLLGGSADGNLKLVEIHS